MKRTVLFLLAVMASEMVLAGISLERTIRGSEQGSELEAVTAMLRGNENNLLIVDRERGALVEYKGTAGARIPLKGEGRAFGSGDAYGITRIDDERFLVSNRDDDLLAVIDARGKLIQRIGESGDQAGQLDAPSGVAWSGNNRLYVADRDNNRISVFGEDGVFVHAIGQRGLPEEQRLDQPEQVFVDADERVYVLERHDLGVVTVFSHEGRLLKRLDAAAIQRMTGSEPELTAMTIDDRGLVYLADNENGRVYQIDWQQEKLLASFGSKGEQRGQFEEIAALLVMPGNRIAVADNENHKIEIYRLPENGRKPVPRRFLTTVGFERNIKLACDKAYRLQGGNVLCLDAENDRVATYRGSGRLMQTFSGEFSQLRAASVDDQDVVILDDEKIKIYKLDGRMRFEAGASGEADGQFDSPRDVFLARDRIYVADTGNRRIQVFSRDGIFLNKIANREDDETALFSSPSRVAVNNSNLFVMDEDVRQVLVFSLEGHLQYRIGRNPDDEEDDEAATDSMHDMVFEQLYDIDVDPDGNLYILAAIEGNPATVQVFNGPNRLISFGAQIESRAGLQQPVSLSIPPARKTIVSVYDDESGQLKNYKFKQLPPRPAGLEVLGASDQTQLRWDKVPGSFTSRYRVFGARDRAGPFRYLTDVSGLVATVKHEGPFSPRFYRITAVSGFSVESEPSNVREDMFQAGYALYRQEKYQQAFDVFTASYKADNRNGSVVKYLGLSALRLGRLDQAIAFFTELGTIEGFETEGYNLQIRALVENREYVSAKAVIDRLIEADRASIDTIVYCGELSLKLGDAIGAIDCLEAALKQDANHVKAHFLLGRAYIRLGIEDKGLNEFARAEEIDPKNSDVWYRSGMMYKMLGKHDEAVKRFEMALEMDEDNADAKLALAQTRVEQKQYDLARNIAIELAGDLETRAEGHYLLGITAFATADYGQALLSLTKATRADPANTDAWLVLVDTYRKRGQDDRVRPALVKAVEANPHSFAAAYRLGNLDFAQKHYADAIVHFEKAVQLQPDDFDARYKLAYCQLQTAKYHQAVASAAAAEQLQPENVDILVLQSEIFNKQGKNGKAVDYLKRALKVSDNDAELYTRLGALYVESSVTELAEQALKKASLLDKTSAAPYVLLGRLYSNQRQYTKAIKALDKAVELAPTEENRLALDTAYADQKSAAEFQRNAPKIVIRDLRLEPVFSAAYKQYVDRPVGTVRIENGSDRDYKNLKLRFSVRDYMNYPYTINIPELKAHDSEKVTLNAVFNNRILEIDEDVGVQIQIAVNFASNHEKDAITMTRPMTIYGKNAIRWRDAGMVGAFVTPKDDTLRDFVRQAINQNKPETDAVDDSLLSAMTLFDVFGAYGINYVVDPNNAYSKLTGDSIDYVQFARETLKLKSGDCDDLSVLMSASLENLGIRTAMLDVPGHLLLMFNTGLPESERNRISQDADLLAIHKGEVWIPLEATMIGQNFAEAWAEGARKYHQYRKQNKLGVIELQEAWQTYRPVTLGKAAESLPLPDSQRVAIRVQRETDRLLEKSLGRLVAPYRAMLSINPDGVDARMQIAIIYAKYGLHEAANREFDKILASDPDNSAVYNNRGNIYFSQGDYERAIENYRYAEKLAANDAGIKMNISMASYQSGHLQTAIEKYREAKIVDEQIDSRYAGYVKLLSQ